MSQIFRWGFGNISYLIVAAFVVTGLCIVLSVATVYQRLRNDAQQAAPRDRLALWGFIVGILGIFLGVCALIAGRWPATSAVGLTPHRAPGQPSGKPGELWRFVVSGDSRNCGDVVMPAIAAGAKMDGASFYWHLGDLRAIYDFDEDMLQVAKLQGRHLTIAGYMSDAWEDFKRNQIAPFESIPMPYYIGIGNHETVPPKTRCEFANSFGKWLVQDGLQESHERPAACSRLTQLPDAAQRYVLGWCDACVPRTYYHWTKAGVDFIYLDNASNEQFDEAQLDWFDGVIHKDADDKGISTVVVGMHKALPWSVSCDHSMNESPEGTQSGEKVYRTLLALQKSNKKVYVLASHSHYFMKDIFNTSRWRNDGVLPGWIIGTAGAQRYPLPPTADLTKSKTYVYGYLLARVYSDGTIDFAFTELKQDDIPTEVRNRYTESWIGETCFDGNRKTDTFPEPAYCTDSGAQKQ